MKTQNDPFDPFGRAIIILALCGALAMLMFGKHHDEDDEPFKCPEKATVYRCP